MKYLFLFLFSASLSALACDCKTIANPLNEKVLMIDLIEKLDAEVVLVSKNYLGSVNHTLLSAELLKMRKIKIRSLIISGESNQSTEEIISKYLDIAIIRVPFFNVLSKSTIYKFVSKLDL